MDIYSICCVLNNYGTRGTAPLLTADGVQLKGFSSATSALTSRPTAVASRTFARAARGQNSAHILSS